MKVVFRLALAVYLLAIAFFAFRPFQPIHGRTYPDAAPATNGVVCAGAALEDMEGSRLLRESLAKTGRMSLEVLLKSDALGQGGPARVISLSLHTMCRNFTLGQDGNGLAFRLRTSETDGNGMYPSLLVPQVFDENRFQHFVVTYDGGLVQLFVDGVLHPQSVELQGDFSNWGKNHLLTVGDEPSGVRPWKGRVAHFSVYDRALESREVELLKAGGDVPGAVYSFPVPNAMRPLRYRNLFVNTDPFFNLGDCVANIVAFVPLAPLLCVVFLARLRKPVAVVAVPLVAGFLISGVIELLQRGIMGRVPCLADLAYNVLGTLIGCGLLWLGLKHRGVSAMMRTEQGDME
ncbi:hypothetical protein PDESU_03389 [Pontiella desulfatans]|uniref:VanZ-like domain-containing protein n=1 Tax=Pontiella desulfatans TaxID=2750659 RepID=A0A6C2U4B6_PONDE|nr:LamG-like jellyroll fold domain-containing protein [Pontiella desulfatans]VGO14820.1 hypothetical protein PDESU_03389 [Pontiella desulfatans]